MSLQTRLTALAQAIGADIKSLQSQINSLSSGSDPWTRQLVTTTLQNQALTGNDVVTGFAPVANARYNVEALLMVQSAVATTGIQVALMGPTSGITRAAVKIVSASAQNADKIDYLGLNGLQIATAGVTTPTLVSIDAIIEVGATPGTGNVRPQYRSEVSGSIVSVFPGSFMRWRTV